MPENDQLCRCLMCPAKVKAVNLERHMWRAHNVDTTKFRRILGIFDGPSKSLAERISSVRNRKIGMGTKSVFETRHVGKFGLPMDRRR